MNTHQNKQTLRDLGERNIVEQLIAPRFRYPDSGFIGVGDDCAVIPPPPAGHSFVFTTDPCPTPVVCLLEAPDFYHYGRLTVLINVSDLAAMGASPVGLLVSTVMPEAMTTQDYERFLDGLADASREWNCPILGGNIKDGAQFTATGSALGVVESELVMLRTGTAPGDRVFVIGDMGLFWSACLTRLAPEMSLEHGYVEYLNKSLYRPQPRIREGMALARTRRITSCIDSSDGVIGCLRELALRNSVNIVVESDLLRPHPAVEAVASKANIDVRKLMLSWGDWQLVCTVSPQASGQISTLMQSLGTVCFDVGEVQAGAGVVYLQEQGRLEEITNFASERFSETSFFTHGLEAYIELLRSQPLTIRTTPPVPS
jgi:thiamine-monophosphate kinase